MNYGVIGPPVRQSWKQTIYWVTFKTAEIKTVGKYLVEIRVFQHLLFEETEQNISKITFYGRFCQLWSVSVFCKSRNSSCFTSIPHPATKQFQIARSRENQTKTKQFLNHKFPDNKKISLNAPLFLNQSPTSFSSWVPRSICVFWCASVHVFLVDYWKILVV